MNLTIQLTDEQAAPILAALEKLAHPLVHPLPNYQTTMKKPLVIDTLIEARRDLAEVLEEMGAVAMHIREAIDAGEAGNAPFATACIDDAQSAIDNAITELTKIREKAGRWAVWAESEIECEECEGTGQRSFAANCGEYTPCVDCGGAGRMAP